MKGKIENMEINCLIDTGANRSVLHPRKYWQIPETKRPPLHSTTQRIRVANGNRVQPLGEVSLPLTLRNVGTIQLQVLVAEIEEPLVLGNDFLCDTGCSIDVKNQTLHLEGKDIPCFLEDELPSVFRIRLSSDVVVPGNCEYILPAYIQTDCSAILPEEVIIDGNPRIMESKGILFARVLVNTASTHIPVRVCNPTDEEITLFKETILGMGESSYQTSGSEEKCYNMRQENNSEIPEHLKSLWEDCKHLDESQHLQVGNLLKEYADIFAKSKSDLGYTTLVEHTINTGNTAPIKQRPRRLPLAKKEAEKEEVKKMLDNDIIEPSVSPWASPIVMVTKKDGSIRFCVDYRKLNEITLKDSYPLPRIDDCLDTLQGTKWFSTFDLASGYWQMGVHPDDRPKTAFTCQSGLYQFKVMPFGLTNAPSSFERLMEKVLTSLQHDICLIYLDDIIVKSNDFDQHITHLRMVFERIKQAGLKFSPKKCHLFQKQVQFLGHIVSEDGVATDPKKVCTVRDWPVRDDPQSR